MPLSCYVHHIGHIEKHSHETFEIIFVLSGKCTLILDDHLYQLKEDDVIIVQNLITHELYSNDCVYVSLQLDQARLENTFPNPLHPLFECNSQIEGKEDSYDKLRQKIAFIIKNNADKPAGYELKNWIYIYELLEILYLYFRVESTPSLEKKNHRYAARIYEISKIIKEHYTEEDLTLASLAEMMHLSVPYLSKFFQKHFGVNYLTYLTRLRLKNAIYDLINTEKSIETISSDCGFPNSNAFTSAFKKEYGTLPSAYRRNAKIQKTEPLPLEYHDYMVSLRKYLAQIPSSSDDIPLRHETVHCSVTNTPIPLRHSWRNIISVGQASDLLLADIQTILIKTQTELHFSYIFFNDIFSDTLNLFHINGKGEPVYNYAYVDKIMDFILSLSLKPMISFSYMPKDLAQNPDHFLFNHLVSEPNNHTLWCSLVRNFMEHVIFRYGFNEILTWRFSVWHQPNTPTRLFGFSNPADFFSFYKETWDVVKSFHSSMVFGLPCMYYLDERSDNHFLSDMLEWCSKNHCMPDYLNFTFYDTLLNSAHNNSKAAFGFIDSMTLNPSPDGLRTAVSRIKKIQKQLNSIPVYISEWNNTPSQQDYLNDTCFKACYIAKNIAENYDQLDGLAYWTLTDLVAEHEIPDTLFFGGLGLYTKSGIPKASYYAMRLLSMLGDNCIGRGEGWFATKTENEIRILAYHYKHYTDLYALGERFDMNATDRYTMFHQTNKLNLKLLLENVEDRVYNRKEYVLNQDYGSAFDTWVKCGCADPESGDENEYLISQSQPFQKKSSIAAENHTLSLDITMNVLEVRLIILK